MDARAALQLALAQADDIVESYVKDLTDAELLVRPVPGINHIAWQLGHYLAGQNMMIDGVAPGSMPKLPVGFVEKHTKETSTSDDAKKFCSKEEYVRLWKEQRSAMLSVLAKTSDADFDKPGPEKFRSFLKTVADAFAMQATHAVMHAGQWAVIRRKLGRPPLF